MTVQEICYMLLVGGDKKNHIFDLGEVNFHFIVEKYSKDVKYYIVTHDSSFKFRF